MLKSVLNHPLPVLLATVLIALAGLAGLRSLPVDLFPHLDYPLVNVISHYPAGTAEDMELLVTRPLEQALSGLAQVKRIRSSSTPGSSQITVEFAWGVGILQARQLVSSRLANAQLPKGVSPVLQQIGASLAMLSTYTLSGGDPIALRAWAQYQLAPRLRSVPGVARLEVMGGGERAWRIDLNPLALKQFKLTAQDIAEAVRAASVLDTGGYVQAQGRDLLVRTDGRLSDVKSLRHVSLGRRADGQPLTLEQVAQVYEGALPQRYVIRVDGQPAVAFNVQKQAGASTLAVSEAVAAALARTALPEGAHLTRFYDQAQIIGLSYANLRNNLLLGALLAIAAVVWVLGRRRASFIIAVSFPLVLLATFGAMAMLGLGLNLMTLAALTVALGLMDDDAVVVLENIERHQGLGKTPWQSALDGTAEVFAADVSGTLTVLAAFVPLLLIGGLAGRLFTPFALTFVLVIFFSLLFSLTLIPLAAAYWGRSGQVASQGMGARWLVRLGVWNLRLLDHLMAHRRKTLAATSALFIISLALLGFNSMRFLPLLDENSLLLSYQLAPGTALGETDRVGAALSKQLLAMPSISHVFRRTGSPDASFYLEGTEAGELVLRLDRTQASDPQAVRAQVEQFLAEQAGVIGRVNEPTTEKLDESFSGLPGLFGITLYGEDLPTLYSAAARVEAAAGQVGGLVNVVNNTKIAVDQLRVAVDRAALARFDVSAEAVAQAVRVAMQGEHVSELLVAQRPIAVFLRYGAPYRADLEGLARVQVPNRQGQLFSLAQLGRIEPLSSYPLIEHQQGVRSLTLGAEIEGNPFSVMAQLQQRLHDLQLPKTISWAFSGEYGQLLQTGGQMLWVVLAASLLVYGVIAMQLGNLLDPLVVLTKLPLDFMGAALALVVTRQHLDLTVAIGFVTLIGVSTNNGIMLLTFTRSLRAQGLSAMEAVREAVRLRTRPMLLTHLTTLLALIPAALGLGSGPQLLQPLGIMLFGGLTAGTVLSLNLLPVIYMSTERWRRPVSADASV